LLTDSQFKLNSLDYTQEIFDISHHKITFEHDEDTTRLVIKPTLTTVETLLSNNSSFSAGNAPIALENYFDDVEADKSQFIHHGPKNHDSKTRIAHCHMYC
jgi:hypothetical protein